MNTSSAEGRPDRFPNGGILYFDRAAVPWTILVAGRADSEAATRHLADIYADSDHRSPP